VSLEASCYAVRRVNPFLGVTQVVELDIGRALSTDGINWEIQLAVERPVAWGSLNRHRSERQYCRYAIWSNQEGFARFPVQPALDRRAMGEAAQTLVDSVGARRSMLPFPLTDCFEVWLLDGTNQAPVALLATATGKHLIPSRPPAAWSAAPADQEGFSSGSLIANASPQETGFRPRHHLDCIERLIARRAGSARRTKCFERGDHGAGPDAIAFPTVSLHQADLPELSLAENWNRAEDTNAIGDYLAWLAPRLLTLPLAPGTRARMERAAASNPALVERLFRLYPAIADQDLINRIRVEARLMNAAAHA
jgi:hypothetical protein